MAAGQLWDELRRRPAPGEAAGSELLTRAEAAAGRRGAGVTWRAAPGARARGVAPGGHRALEQGGRAAPASQMLRSCMAVVESSGQRTRSARVPGRDMRGDAFDAQFASGTRT